MGFVSYLCNQYQDHKNQSQPTAIHATNRLERDLIDRVTVICPRTSKPNMRKANTTPRKERRQTRQRQEPVKHRRPIGIQIHIGQKPKEQDCNHTKERPAGAVDIGEDLGRITLLAQSRQRARTTVHATDANRDDGHEDDDVHERVEALEASILADQDERRGVNIRIRVGAEEILVGRGDEQADKEQAQDVKEGDSPKHLLDGTGEGFYGILGLRGSQAHQLCARESKRGRYKDGAKAAKTILESARVVPEPCAPVVVVQAILGSTAEDEDEGDDDEDDGCAKLE